MRTTRRRTATLVATVTAGLALALTACGGPGNTGSAAADPGTDKGADRADRTASPGAAGGASAAGAGVQDARVPSSGAVTP
ncbi:hypothetical protein OHS33_17490 [Streptomyces sp. NBC_00536]|uniref:hypothetical protein n=1 Tax=Streptomyces sp. NBC_00536 TaxID=2975769 RepID=UPI002E819608|nr:hypothetical protein [Streptomyces sp. NBC_00536]WUC79976.1 hypothetical protein OHS33_17490 [Streptomyces sp. NBC_00536]